MSNITDARLVTIFWKHMQYKLADVFVMNYAPQSAVQN